MSYLGQIGLEVNNRLLMILRLVGMKQRKPSRRLLSHSTIFVVLMSTLFIGVFIGSYMDFRLAYLALLVCIVALVCWPWLKRSDASDALEPRRFFPLVFGFYSLPALLAIYINETALDIGFDPVYMSIFGVLLDTVTFAAALLCLMGLVGFYIGYSLPFGTNLALKLKIPARSINPVKLAFFSVFVLVVVSIMAIQHSNYYGGVGSYIISGYARLRSIAGIPTFLSASVSMMAAALILIYFSARLLKNRIALLLALILVSSYAAVLIAAGNRRVLFILAFTLVAFEYYRRPRRPSPLIAILILLLVSGGLSVIGLLRSNSIDAYPQAAKELLPRFLSIALTSPFTSGEGQTPFLAYTTMLRAVPERIPYRFGSSYMQWIPTLVPRALWPNKPIGLTQQYMSMFHPYSSQGFAYFFLAESVLNFGFMGPVAIMLAIGIGLRTLYEVLSLNASKSTVILFYALFIAYIPSLVRSDSTIFAELLREYVFPILIALFLSSERLLPEPSRKRDRTKREMANS